MSRFALRTPWYLDGSVHFHWPSTLGSYSYLWKCDRKRGVYKETRHWPELFIGPKHATNHIPLNQKLDKCSFFFNLRKNFFEVNSRDLFRNVQMSVSQDTETGWVRRVLWRYLLEDNFEVYGRKRKIYFLWVPFPSLLDDGPIETIVIVVMGSCTNLFTVKFTPGDEFLENGVSC